MLYRYQRLFFTFVNDFRIRLANPSPWAEALVGLPPQTKLLIPLN